MAYAKHGLETASLICGVGAWPTRFGEAPPRGPGDTGTTTSAYGSRVPCHAEGCYVPPLMPAGQSARVGSYYHKTGCLQDRVSEGFRETKASCMAPTETSLPNYGTIRKAGRTMLLKAPPLAMPPTAPSFSSTAAPSAATPRDRNLDSSMSARGEATSAGAAGGNGGGVLRSAPDGRQQPEDQQQYMASTRKEAKLILEEALSQRSKRSSLTSAAPSWALKNNARHAWNFDPLPFYEKQSETIGKYARTPRDAFPRRPAAGKSESGFMTPTELIATLTIPALDDS